MYSNIVLNIFNNPKNAGRISKPDAIAAIYNNDNTAHVEFSFRIESGTVTECKFRAQANPYIIAICSTITQMLKGKMVSMIFIDPYSIKKELGDEQPINIDFCIDCVKLAIQEYKEQLQKENKRNKKEINESIEQNENADIVESENVITEEVVATKENIVTEATVTEQIDNNDDGDDDFDFIDFFDEEDF